MTVSVVKTAVGTVAHGTSCALSYTPSAAGNQILLCVTSQTGAAAVLSVSDTSSMTWSKVVSETEATTQIQWWRGRVTGSGATTITVASTVTAYIAMAVLEVAGAASTGWTTHSATKGGSSTTPSVTALTVTTPGSLAAIGCVAYHHLTATPGSPWTAFKTVLTGGSYHGGVAYQVTGSDTSSATWTTATSGAWATVGVVIPPATGALTLYGVTGTGGSASLGKLTTSSTTTAATHTAANVGSTTTKWNVIRTHTTAGTGTASEPGFTGSHAPSVWNVTTVAGKQFVAGTWSQTLKLHMSSAHTFTGSLRLRVGYKVGTTYTQAGADIVLAGVTITTVAATYTISGTLAAFTIPVTGKLVIQVVTYGKTGHTTTTYIVVALGLTHAPLVTPGYQTPHLTAKASFIGSGIFAATGSLKASASFIGSGVFTASGHPTIAAAATFIGSGVFAAAAATYAPSLTGMPQVAVELALTGTVWEGSNWVTIAPFVTAITTTRGRQHVLQRPEAGQLTMRVSNRDGRFNPWSTNGPYYNQLPPTDSNPTTGAGTLTFVNATGPRSTTQARFGLWSWALTATSTSSMTAQTDSTTACVPGRTYQAMAFVRAKTAARSCSVGIVWKNAGGSVLSTTTGTAVTDSLTGWTMLLVSGVAPATAVKKDVVVTVISPLASQVHYLACLKISDVTHVQGLAAVTPGWCVGQRVSLTQAQPIRITATWQGVTYPIFAGAISGWTPKYGMIAADITVGGYDYMHLLANWPAPGSLYPGIIIEQDPSLYWRLTTPLGSTSVDDFSGNGHTGTITTGTLLSFGHTGALSTTVTATSADLSAGTAGTAKVAATLTAPLTFSIETLVMQSVSLPASPHGGSVLLAGWQAGLNIRAVVQSTAVFIAAYNGTTLLSSTTPSRTALKLTANTWYYVALTHASTGATKLYLNGLNVYTGTVSPSASTTFQVGGKVTGTTWGGLFFLEEVAAWAAALSQTTVTQHFAAFTRGYVTLLSGQMIRTMLLTADIPSSAIGTIATGTVEVVPPNMSSGQTQLLQVLQTIELTETGLLVCGATGMIYFYSQLAVRTLGTSKGTFSNDGTRNHYPVAVPPVPVRDDITLFNTVGVSIQGSTTVHYATTKPSVARYGSRMLTGYTSTYFKNVATAKALAALLVTKFGTPRTRVAQITLSSVANGGGNLPQMLGRNLLDAVTVTFQPTDGTDSPFEQIAQIEQIKHSVTKTQWKTTFVLALPL